MSVNPIKLHFFRQAYWVTTGNGPKSIVSMKMKTLYLLTFQTQNIVGYPKVILFEHFGIIRFWVMLRSLVWKMHFLLCIFHTKFLLTLWPWPWPLTFQSHHQLFGYPKVIRSLYQLPSLNTLGYSFLSYAPDKQTNKQANKQDRSERPTHSISPTDRGRRE